MDGESRLRFNASHSGNVGVYAFALGCDLGIDVEQVRALDDRQSIASRFFCRDEATQVTLLQGHDLRSAFFRCCTRKEAYIKAVGGGLSMALDSFQATLRGEDPVRFVRIGGDTQEAAR